MGAQPPSCALGGGGVSDPATTQDSERNARVRGQGHSREWILQPLHRGAQMMDVPRPQRIEIKVAGPQQMQQRSQILQVPRRTWIVVGERGCLGHERADQSRARYRPFLVGNSKADEAGAVQCLLDSVGREDGAASSIDPSGARSNGYEQIDVGLSRCPAYLWSVGVRRLRPKPHTSQLCRDPRGYARVRTHVQPRVPVVCRPSGDATSCPDVEVDHLPTDHCPSLRDMTGQAQERTPRLLVWA